MEEHRSKTILIIENDDSLMHLLQALFQDAGFKTYCVQHVDDIFALVEHSNPDVILLDYLLPGINGGELCAQLKREPSTRQIPVVICSAYPQVMLSLGNYGCNAFIAKPFEIDDMIFQVEDCLKNPEKAFTGKLVKVGKYLA